MKLEQSHEHAGGYLFVQPRSRTTKKLTNTATSWLGSSFVGVTHSLLTSALSRLSAKAYHRERALLLQHLHESCCGWIAHYTCNRSFLGTLLCMYLCMGSHSIGLHIAHQAHILINGIFLCTYSLRHIVAYVGMGSH